MLFDTHAHVNFKGFKEDAEEVIQRALDAGVSVVNVGTQLDTSKEAVSMAEKFAAAPPLPLGEGRLSAEALAKEEGGGAGVYAVIGLHPVHTYAQDLQEEETHFKTRAEVFDYEEYKKLAQNPKVVGIGECGLDYFRLPVDGNHEEAKKLQAEAFILQLRLAKELDKALVIHSRSSKGSDDACLDILEILKKELAAATPLPLGEGRGGGLPRFELHSYTGSPEVAKMFVDLGAYFSFNGILTFDKTGNQEAVLKVVPDDKILLETDCPYLTPVPMRGKRNEPAYVQYVAGKMAEIKDVDVGVIETITSKNASALFRIPF